MDPGAVFSPEELFGGFENVVNTFTGTLLDKHSLETWNDSDIEAGDPMSRPNPKLLHLAGR